MMIVMSRCARCLEPFEEFGFAAHVEMRRRLVQEQDFRIADQHARQSDRLLLAAGQAAPAFGDRHVVAQRMAGDEALDAGKPRRREHFCVGRVGPAKRDVVAQLAEKQIGVLQHEADAGAQIGRVVLADVDAIDQDVAFVRVVETGQQAADRGLARSDAADDARRVRPGAILNDTFSSAFIAPLRILEGHVFKSDAALVDRCGRRSVRSGGRSRSSDMTRSIALSAVNVCVARVITAAMPADRRQTRGRPASSPPPARRPTACRRESGTRR